MYPVIDLFMRSQFQSIPLLPCILNAHTIPLPAGHAFNHSIHPTSSLNGQNPLFYLQVMDVGAGEEETALIYAINSWGGNQTGINPNWVSPQNQMQHSTEGHTNGSYLPQHSIGLLVCIVPPDEEAARTCQDFYGQCIEQTFR